MPSYQILVVDDEPNVLASLIRTLRHSDYTLVECASAEEALAFLGRAECEADVVLCDQKMPGMQGLELLNRIRVNYPNTVRIMLTGENDLALAKSAINKGEVFRFLNKPCNPDELRSIIRQALTQRDLWCQNQRLVRKARQQRKRLEELEALSSELAKAPSEDDFLMLEDDNETLDDFVKKHFSVA